MAENQFFVDSDKLSEKALEHKHKLETDPSCRTNHMEYMEGMEQINSDVMDKVLSQMNSYDYDKYTAVDVRRALNSETCNVEDFKALLSPAAAPFLEEWHRGQRLRRVNILEIRCICLHLSILLTIVRIIVFIVVLTATMTLTERNSMLMR